MNVVNPDGKHLLRFIQNSFENLTNSVDLKVTGSSQKVAKVKRFKKTTYMWQSATNE